MESKNIIKKYIQNNVGGIALILVIIGIFSITELVAAYLLGKFIDELLLISYIGLVRICVLVLINFGINSICRFLRQYQSSKVYQKTVYELKKEISEKIMNAQINDIEKEKVDEATISSIMMNEVNVAAQTISSTLVSMLQEPTIAIFAVVFLIVYLDWRIALIICVSTPITIIVGNYFGKRLQKKNTIFYQNIEKSNKFIIESFNGLKIIKAYLAEKNTCSRYNALNKKIYENLLDLSYFQGLNEATIIFTGFISYLGLYLGGGILVKNGNISVGNLVSAFQLISFITWPIAGFGGAIASYKNNLAAWKRIEVILNLCQEKNDEQTVYNITPEILTFRNVSFSYPNSQDIILKNISFDLRIGDVVALVGENGTGKSTLFKLLLKFYSPNEGKIKLGNSDYAKLSVKDLRKQIAYVSQEVMIWDGSLKDNILFGMESDMKLSQHESVLKELELYELVLKEKMGEKIESKELSVGFKQRLALARAIIVDRPIVLIDEGTANIDKLTEKKIVDNFREWFEDKIVIIIAHGTFAYEISNRIFLLSNSSLVETKKDDAKVRSLLLNSDD